MNEKSKELLDEVRAAFEKMPNDPEGLAGWLLSNYKLVKVGDGEPVNFYGRAPARQEAVDEQQIRVNPNNKFQKFLKNTGLANQINATAASVSNPKRPSVKDLVNRMHNDIEAEEAALLEGNEFDQFDQYDEYDEYDEYFHEYEQNRVAPKAKSLANNWAPAGEQTLSPEEKAAMQAAINGISQAGPPNAPMPSGQFSPNNLHRVNQLHPALEHDREYRNSLSANVGGGVGLIRRK